jgi:NitT/TauT family transport system permease protein
MKGKSHPLSKWFRHYKRVILGATTFVLFVLVWEGVGQSKLIPPIFISRPSIIFQVMVRELIHGKLLFHMTTSLLELTWGYLISIAIGVPLGLLMGRYRKIEFSLDPFTMLLYSTPIIALYPLIIIWAGIGKTSIVVITFLFAVFPIIVNTFTGVQSVDPSLVRAARSFGAREGQIFYKIVLPAAIPIVIAGLRLGLGRALIGVVIGEMFGGTAGLGYLIAYSGAFFKTANLFASLLIVVLMGIVFTQALKKVEENVARYRHGGT